MSLKGFSLSWLRITEDSLPPAEIEFKPGFNVISGASNTGKSSVLSCVNFVLGAGNVKLSSELKKYSAASVGIIDSSGQRRIIRRNLRGGDCEVLLAGSDWSSGAAQKLKSKHSRDKTDTLSHWLLSLVDLQDAYVWRGEKKDSSKLSFRELSRFLVVNEKRIIDDQTPVYPGLQHTNNSTDFSVFRLLLTGNDVGKITVTQDVSVAKTVWRTKAEIYDQLIGGLEERIILNGFSLIEIDRQITDIDAQVSVVSARISDNNKAVSVLMEQRKSALDVAQISESRLMALEQLIERFRLLREHYISDLERLKFISEGDFLLSQLGAPHCPYCGLLLDEHTAEELDAEKKQQRDLQVAADAETVKIEVNLRDLDQTLAALTNEKESRTKTLEEQKYAVEDVGAKMTTLLEPKLITDNETLSRLIIQRNQLSELKSDLERLEALTLQRDAIGDEPKRAIPVRQKLSDSTSFNTKSLRDFSDEIQETLQSWNFPAKIVEFSSEWDIVFDGESRNVQGKGYMAVLHAAFTIALMTYCNRRSLHHPGFVIIDSPLTSYKEGDPVENSYAVAENIQEGFFQSLAKMPGELQVIVLDNKSPSEQISQEINHIHFTKVKGQGRYGFVPATDSE
jgi:hypothetical protein